MARIYADKTEGREAQGYSWASQAGAVLPNAFASELARDYEIYRPFCYANGPAFCASRKMWKIEKNTGLRLVSLSVYILVIRG
jgi:hypothetical protein